MDADTFAALAHELRLRIFRLLVAAGPDGLAAGEIGDKLDVGASTLSAHLAQLERVGLLRSHREHRRIIYAIDTEGTQGLVSFLVDDCCGGRPELCGLGTKTRGASVTKTATRQTGSR
jgi:ArsR family transcriptional regulator, arsenate/arsenite/antimonite-responsive transcriptional repressor